MALSQYDKNNAPLFEKGEKNRYLCCMCGQYTTLKDSSSYKGYNLICNHCLYKIAGLLDATAGEIITKIQEKGRIKNDSLRTR